MNVFLSGLHLPKLLRELQNDNVVRLEDIFVDTISKELVIAFEYAEYDLLVRKEVEKFGFEWCSLSPPFLGLCGCFVLEV